jgi:hypothetical protein
MSRVEVHQDELLREIAAFNMQRASLGFVPKRGLEISRTALAAGFLAKPGASALRLIVLEQSLVA